MREKKKRDCRNSITFPKRFSALMHATNETAKEAREKTKQLREKYRELHAHLTAPGSIVKLTMSLYASILILEDIRLLLPELVDNTTLTVCLISKLLDYDAGREPPEEESWRDII